jgi:hypothetical protein
MKREYASIRGNAIDGYTAAMIWDLTYEQIVRICMSGAITYYCAKGCPYMMLADDLIAWLGEPCYASRN